VISQLHELAIRKSSIGRKVAEDAVRAFEDAVTAIREAEKKCNFDSGLSPELTNAASRWSADLASADHLTTVWITSEARAAKSRIIEKCREAFSAELELRGDEILSAQKQLEELQTRLGRDLSACKHKYEQAEQKINEIRDDCLKPPPPKANQHAMERDSKWMNSEDFRKKYPEQFSMVKSDEPERIAQLQKENGYHAIPASPALEKLVPISIVVMVLLTLVSAMFTRGGTGQIMGVMVVSVAVVFGLAYTSHRKKVADVIAGTNTLAESRIAENRRKMETDLEQIRVSAESAIEAQRRKLAEKVIQYQKIEGVPEVMDALYVSDVVDSISEGRR